MFWKITFDKTPTTCADLIVGRHYAFRLFGSKGSDYDIDADGWHRVRLDTIRGHRVEVTFINEDGTAPVRDPTVALCHPRHLQATWSDHEAMLRLRRDGLPGAQATSLSSYGIELWAEDAPGEVRVAMGGEAYVVHAPTVAQSETWDSGLMALGGGRLAALLCDEPFERLFMAELLNEAGSCPQLEQSARALLATVPDGATPGRVAKLVTVLAEHPQAQLETCADERTGARYGEAACRAGRAVKLGYSTNHYQIWAVWPKEQT